MKEAAFKEWMLEYLTKVDKIISHPAQLAPLWYLLTMDFSRSEKILNIMS